MASSRRGRGASPDSNPGVKASHERPNTLWILVQPRAGRTETVGWHGDAVKIRIKAPPVEGAANKELVRFLSKTVGVPQQAVRIVGGKAARRKRVEIDGVDQATAIASLGL